MKFVCATNIFACLIFSASASADCRHDRIKNAEQSYDSIIAEASKDVDIEQDPSKGNSQMNWILNAQQSYDSVIAEASKDVDIEQDPSEGNSQMNWMLWKEKHLSKKDS